MKWTDLLNAAIEENFRVTDALMAMVDDDELDWKPASGTNWMTTGQLLMHLTTACGACCRGDCGNVRTRPDQVGCPGHRNEPGVGSDEIGHRRSG